jgi:hypothetical protein
MTIRSLSLALALVPALTLIAASEPAEAGDEMSLKDKKEWAQMTKVIEDRAEAASKKCETKISAKWDVASFKGTDLFQDSPTAKCRDLVYNVENLCTTDHGKAAVKEHVATITCKKSTDGTSVSRDGKALTVGIDRKSSAIKGAKPGSYSWKSALEEIL